MKTRLGKEAGRFQVPPGWPAWKVRCKAHRRNLPDVQCKNWAVVGMPTCKKHGSGGIKHRQLGMIRYLSWVITGGPKDMPAELAATVALYAFSEAVINQGKGTPEQQMKAALWLTQLAD